MNKSRRVRHADIWSQLDNLLDQRRADSFLVTKIKGHATRDDVLTGHVSIEDKLGNDAADALAVAGALVNPKAEQAHYLRPQLNVTMNVQKMMVEIVIAHGRARAEQHHMDDLDTDSESGEGGAGSTTTDSAYSEEPPD